MCVRVYVHACVCVTCVQKFIEARRGCWALWNYSYIVGVLETEL